MQFYVIKRKHSRYTPPTNLGWEEKEAGSNDESSHSKQKKETHVSIIKEKHQRKHSRKNLPLIRVGRRFSFYTPATNQCWAEKEEGINDGSSH